jgi:hypothetical protein
MLVVLQVCLQSRGKMTLAAAPSAWMCASGAPSQHADITSVLTASTSTQHICRACIPRRSSASLAHLGMLGLCWTHQKS